MKNKTIRSLAAAVALVFGLNARAEILKNGSFEDPVGPEGAADGWGGHGELFGETSSLDAGTPGNPGNARDGSRILLIDVPASTWNGIWQQVGCKEDGSVHFTAHYLIQGGNLPSGVVTFIKLEFYDHSGALITALEGTRRTEDTHGQWEKDELEAVTPAGSEMVRFTILAGSNDGGEVVKNRIYWDAAEAEGDAL